MEGWYKSNKFLYYGTQNSYLATTAKQKAIRYGIKYRYHSVAPHSGEEKEKNRKVVVSKTPGGGRGEVVGSSKARHSPKPQPKATAKAAAQSRNKARRSPKPQPKAHRRAADTQTDRQTGGQAGVRQGVRQRGRMAGPRGSAKGQGQGAAPRRGSHFQGEKSYLPPVFLTEPQNGGKAADIRRGRSRTDPRRASLDGG